MGLFLIAALLVGGIVIGRLFRPQPEDLVVDSLSSSQFPTAGEGEPVPVITGVCHVTGGNLVWVGDGSTQDYVNADGVPIAVEYFYGMDLVLCHGPVDELLELRFDDKVCPFISEDLGFGVLKLTIDQPYFFGPTALDGGVSGTIMFYRGTDPQSYNDYMRVHQYPGVLGSVPTMDGICHMVFQHFKFGTSATPRTVSCVLRKNPNTLGLSSGDHNIGGDSNPAAFLYEILTHALWGCQISSGQIDIAGFRSVGAVLADEALGVSFNFDRKVPAKAMLAEVCRHIDGIIFQRSTTGLYTLKIARADYDPDDIPVFSAAELGDVEIRRPTWEETANVVKVRYTDRASNFAVRVSQAQELANAEARGGDQVVEAIDFLGLSNAASAQKAAARVLNTIGYPFATLTLPGNRKLAGLERGDPFKLTLDDMGLQTMICRYMNARAGTLESGRVVVEAVEDRFGVDWTAFTPTEPPLDPQPVEPPVPLLYSRLEECPFGVINSEYPRRIIELGVRDEVVSFIIAYTRRDGAGLFLIPPLPWLHVPLPGGQLNASVTSLSTSFTLKNTRDLSHLLSVTTQDLDAGLTIWVIGTEWGAWQNVVDNGDGTYTFSGCIRGVLDTTPKPHSTNADVYFFQIFRAPININNFGSTTVSVDVKLITVNVKGALAQGSAPTLTHVLTDRAARPPVPTNIRLNGALYPVSITGQLVVTWSHRNRLVPSIYSNANATTTMESGRAYRIRVYGELGTLVHTELGLTGTTWTYLTATEISESGLGRVNNQLRVVMESYRVSDNLFSHQAFDFTFARV